jgi:hypothetical protein
MPPTMRTPLVDGLAGDPADVVDQVTRGYLLLDDTVIAFADADHVAGLVLLVARRTGLSCAAVERALTGKSAGPATLMCRAAGLGANGFSAVLRMRRRRVREEEVSPVAALSGFLAMPVDVARRTVAMMKTHDRS